MVERKIIGSVRVNKGFYFQLVALVNDSNGKIRSIQHALEICGSEGLNKAREIYKK